MQIWIYFNQGVGGDGIVNLLEHAHEAVPIDLQTKWRVHRYVDYRAKFWTPDIDNGFIRAGSIVDPDSIEINQDYAKTVIEDNQYAVVPSHDVAPGLIPYYVGLDKKFKILVHNQIKIWLRTRDLKTACYLSAIKNLRETSISNIDHEVTSQIESHIGIEQNFDHQVYIEDLQDSWEYTRDFFKNVGLTIEKHHYDQYMDIVKSRVFYVTPGIAYYASSQNKSGKLQYQKLDDLNFSGVLTKTN